MDKRLTLTDQENKLYHPEAIIIASGASLRRLGVPSEEEFVGRGRLAVRDVRWRIFSRPGRRGRRRW